MRIGRTTTGTVAVFVCLLTAAAAAAAPAGAPSITDPEGDTRHREYGWEEPTLDVTEVAFGWSDGALRISVLLPHADVLGPDGTMDPFSPGAQWTYVDVYWSMEGADYLARAYWNADGDVGYEAGQGIRIHREALWEDGADIHGDATPQSGTVEAEGNGHRVTILVDPAAVGAPGPGDLLEAPAFSSYIDHHVPVAGDDWPAPHPVGAHHPANADVNDAPGLAFRVPLVGDDVAEDLRAEASDAARAVPTAPALVTVLVLGLAVVLRRP